MGQVGKSTRPVQGRSAGGLRVLPQQRSQGGQTEPPGAAGEELAPGLDSNRFVGKHSRRSPMAGHLFNTSSRFKNWLATIVQAANSAFGRLPSASESPTERAFSA